MADEQDALQPNPSGLEYSLSGGGERRGVWGGKGAGALGTRLKDPNDPSKGTTTVWAPSGRQEDVDRYRQMGELSHARSPVQLQYGAANQSLGHSETSLGYAGAALQQVNDDRANAARARGSQTDALGLQRSAALGQQPSRAEILGRGLIDQSLKSQMAGAAGARGGPLAQMAAQRRVQQNAAGFQQQGMNQLSALRADEMERARAAYGTQANALRTSDYQGADNAMRWGQGYQGIANQFGHNANLQAGMAQSQGNMDMAQRQLNQGNQQFYEQLGWNTNNAAMNAGLDVSGMEQQNYWNSVAKEQADRAFNNQQLWNAVGVGGDVTGTLVDYSGRQQPQSTPSKPSNGGYDGRFFRDNPYDDDPHSDMRTKNPIPPLLLDTAGRKPKAEAPNWLDKFMNPALAQQHAKQSREEHDERLEQLDAPNIYRDDPYAGPTPGGIQRQDPYAEDPDSAEVFFSDTRAKQEAFQEGVLYGGLVKRPGDEDRYRDHLPGYMRNKDAPVTQGAISGDGSTTKGPPQPPTPAAFRERHQPVSSRKSLLVDHLSSAKEKDMANKGEPVMSRERNYSIGDREVERGRPADLPESSVPRPKTLPGGGETIGPVSMDLQRDANRRGAGFPYTYKPEFTPGDQKPGDLNYGPSANELERNPLTATAVRRDPQTGMRQVNVPLLVKSNTASIASLQEQIDKLNGGRRHG